MARQDKKMKISGNRLLALAFLLLIGLFCLMNANVLFDTVSAAGDDLFSVIDKVEEAYNEDFFMKHSFINANGFIHTLLGQRKMNGVVKLNNGYLASTHKKADVAPYAKKLIALDQDLEKKGIPLLYVQAPFKISKYDDQLPEGIKDYSNSNADRLLKLLNKGGVDTLDLRAEMRSDGLDHYSMFFRTDHHWTVEASFWGFTKTIGVMNTKYGFDVDEKS